MTTQTGRSVGPAAGTVVLAATALLGSGPLGFLPPLVRWPLGALALVALWWPKAQQPRTGRWLEALALAAIGLQWLLLRVVGLHPSRADDGIYFYLADRFADGAVPYRDFFFAHPPVHLIVPAVAFKLFGFSLLLAKALPALIQSAAGVFLYLAVRPASRSLAVLTLAVHLFSYQVLMGATDLTGTNLVTAFLAASLWAAVSRRFLAAGAFSALALGSGAYALAGVAAVALTIWRRGGWRRGAVGFGATVVLWIAPFALLGGSRFWDSVFRYHLSKSPGGGRVSVFDGNFVAGVFSNLASWLRQDWLESFYFHGTQWIAAGLALSLLVVARARRRREGPGSELATFGLVAVLLFALQWAALSELYDYYTVPQVALLALPAAWGLWRAFELLCAKETLRPGAVATGVLLLSPLLGRAAQRTLWAEERDRAGEIVSYRWNDPWVPKALAETVRAVTFSPSRERGSPEPGWRHFVWNKSLTLSTAPALAAYLRENTEEGETIAGASTLAPTLALLAGRRLAADEADTNAKRFRSGFFSERAFFEAACAAQVRYLIAAPRAYFSEQHLSRHPTVLAYFDRDREFMETEIRHGRPERYVLFRRRDLPSGSICQFVGQ